MSKEEKKVYYLWLDLETTGLDPESNAILEVAWIITDSELNELRCGQKVFNPGESMAWSPYCAKMHTENGLIEECLKAPEGASYGSDIIFPAPVELSDEIRLAGNSVHFDRGFIRVYWPWLDKKLSHRHFDVSVLRECCKHWAPSLYTQTPDTHRAMDDIRRALDFARLMKSRFGYLERHTYAAKKEGIPKPVQDETPTAVIKEGWEPDGFGN